MWALTCYFNPANVKSRYENYCTFRSNLAAQNIPLLTVELAFNEEPFVLVKEEDAEILIQVRSSSVMWHKERLLNIGLKHLPVKCEKVCWMDCDIIFLNQKWVSQTETMLNKYLVVFPYRCMQFRASSAKPLKTVPSFGSCCVDDPKSPEIRDASIGTWGYACAMRVDMLRRMGGFYDRNIVGGGHRVLAYMMGHTKPDPSEYSRKHYENLCEYLNTKEAFRLQPSHIGAVQGDIVHFWHGSVKDRQYVERYQILIDLEYDPDEVLVENSYGCYEFKSQYQAKYNSAIMEFFKNRKEDMKRAKNK